MAEPENSIENSEATGGDVRRVTVLAPAKLNLTLRVLGRLPSGYHCIESLIVPLSLGDRIAIECRFAASEQAPRIVCRSELTPRLARHVEACTRNDPTSAFVVSELSSPRNLAARAASALLEASGASVSEVILEIEKAIPFGAGLGGGSADAAAVLLGLNELLPEPLPAKTLIRLATTLGSDVPAMLLRAPVFVSGRGEAVDRLAIADPEGSLAELLAAEILIVKPPVAMPTSKAYGLLDRRGANEAERVGSETRKSELFRRLGVAEAPLVEDASFAGNQLTSLARAGIRLRPETGLSERALELLKNDFQEPVAADLSAVADVMRELRKGAAAGVLLAGSGSSCAGFWSSAEDAERLARSLADANPSWFTERCRCLAPL